MYNDHVRFVSYVNTVTHVTTYDSSLGIRWYRLPFKTSNVLSNMRGMAKISYVWDLQASSSNLVILWERCVLAFPQLFLNEFCGHALALAVSKPLAVYLFSYKDLKRQSRGSVNSLQVPYQCWHFLKFSVHVLYHSHVIAECFLIGIPSPSGLQSSWC